MTNEETQLELRPLRPAFDPAKPYPLLLLPPATKLDNPIYTPLLIKARAALAHLDGLSQRFQNPLLLISPAITRESVASSGIENVHTTVADVLQADLLPESERTEPDKEVLRYRDAILWGFDALDTMPISSRLVSGVFRRLMLEGEGRYRKTQNQITNSKTKEPIYTPPAANDISNLISNWEAFVNSTDESIDPLVRCIVAHYQFEAIHPFNDGNGRTGRILMVLQLLQSKLLTYPILFISARLLQDRSEYYRTLKRVTEDGAWEDYILFMLKAFYTQAESTKMIVDKIDNLYNQTKGRVRSDLPKIYTADLIDHIFRRPVTAPTRMAEDLGITYQTASRHLKALQEAGILQSKRHGTFHFYINHKLLTISKS